MSLDLNESGLVKMLSKKKYKDIKENDIESFLGKLKADFELWNKLYLQKYEIEPVTHDDLFDMFCQKEAAIAENEEDREILKELYSEPESDDSKVLFLEKTNHQEVELIDSVRILVEDKRELDRLKHSISKNIEKKMDKVFALETIQDKPFENLDKYKSVFGVIDVTIELLNENETVTNQNKLFLLNKFSEELENLCNQWDRYIPDFAEILDNQREQFAEQNSNEKPDKEKAYYEAKKETLCRVSFLIFYYTTQFLD